MCGRTKHGETGNMAKHIMNRSEGDTHAVKRDHKKLIT